jgi:hypothetical protein
MYLLTQTALVLMAGMYAVRATYSLLGTEPFTPLAIVAALVFCLVLALFHRLAKASRPWLLVTIVMCLIGLGVNALLLFTPGTGQLRFTNDLFSAICMAAWAWVGVACAIKAFRTLPKA